MWWGQSRESQELQPESSSNSVAETDLTEQIEHQDHLIKQLKDLVRQNEQKLSEKDSELAEQKSKLSKIKIQHKAKIAQMTSQLTDAQKRRSSITEQSTETSLTNKKPEDEDDTSSDGIPNHTCEQSQRGRVLLLKKKLEETRSIFEKKEKEMQLDRQEVEKLVENLKNQLEERDQTITTLQSSLTCKTTTPVDDPSTNEIYAQVVYKDNKILELNQQIFQLEGKIMDLQENLREKDEVIQARNKAIQLMTEDLSRRGKTVVDQLDETRDEMRTMQHNFAEYESTWNEEREGLRKEIESSKEKFQLEISEKDSRIIELKDSLAKLESTRYDLSTKNAALQEKLVLLQEKLQQVKKETALTSNEEIQSLMNEISQLKASLQEKDSVISNLQQLLDEVPSKSDGNKSTVKIRAQYVSRIKVLEKRLKEMQDTNQDEKLLLLQQQINTLEEEKQVMQLKLVELEDLKKNKERIAVETEEIKAQLIRQSDELTNHIRMISLLEKDKMDLAASLSEERKENTKLEETNSSLKDKLEELGEIKKGLEDSNKEILEKVGLLETKLKYEAPSPAEDNKEFTKPYAELIKDKLGIINDGTLNLDQMLEKNEPCIMKENNVLPIVSNLEELKQQQESTANEKQQKVKALLKNFCEKHQLTNLSNDEVDNHWKTLLEQQQNTELQVKSLCEKTNVKDIGELQCKWEELLNRNSLIESSLLHQEDEIILITQKCSDLEKELKNLQINSKMEKDELNSLIQNQITINEEIKLCLQQKTLEMYNIERDLLRIEEDKKCLKEEFEFCQVKIEELEKEKENLNSIISEKATLVDKLNHDLLIKEKQIQEFETELSVVNDKYRSLVEENTQKENSLSALKEEIANLHNIKTLYEKALDEKSSLEKKNQSLQENLIMLEKEIVSIKALVEEKEGIISNMQLESNSLRQETEDLKLSLQNEKDELMVVMEGKDLMIHNLTEQIAELNKMQLEDKEKFFDGENKLKYLEEKLRMKNGDVEKLEHHLELKNNDYKLITVKLQELNGENDHLKMILNEKKNRLDRMEEELKIALADLNFMKNVCDEKEASIEDFQDQLLQYSSDITNLKEAKKSLEEQLKLLQDNSQKELETMKVKTETMLKQDEQLSEKRGIIENLQEQLQDLEISNQASHDELVKLKKDNERMQSVIGQQSSELEGLKKDLEEKSQVSMNACNELDETQKKLIEVLEALETSKVSYNSVDSQFQEQIEKIKELNHVIEDKNNTLENLLKEHETNKMELNTITENWEKLKLNIEELNIELSDKKEQLLNLQKETEEYNRSADSHKREQIEAEEKLSILRTNYESLEKENEALLSSKNKSEEVVSIQEKTLEDKENKFKELNQELSEITLSLKLAQEEISVFQCQLFSIQELNERLKDSESNSQLKLKLFEEKHVNLESQLKELSSQLQMKENYIEQILLESAENNRKTISDKDEMKSSLEALKEEHIALQDSHSKLIFDKQMCEKELEELRMKTEFLKNSLQESVDSNSKLKLEYDHVVSEHQTYKNKAESYINDLNINIETLEKNNNEIMLMADSGKHEFLNQILKYQAQIIDLEKTTESLTKDLEIKIASETELKLNLETALKLKEKLQERLIVLEEENIQLNDKLPKLSSDNERLRSQIEDLNQCMQTIGQENSHMKEDLNKTKEILEVISTESKCFESESLLLIRQLLEREELKGLEHTINLEGNSAFSIMDTLSKLKDFTKIILLANDSKKNDIMAFQNQISDLQKTLNQTQNELKQLMVNNVEATETLMLKDEKISFLEDNIKSLFDKNNDSQNTIEKLNQHVKQLHEEIDNIHQTELQNSLKKEELIHDFQSKEQIYQEKIQELENVINNSTNELLKNKEQKNNELIFQVQQAQLELTMEKERAEELKSLIDQLKVENQSCNNKILELNQEIALSKTEIETLTNNITALNEIKTNLNAEKEEHLLTLNSLHQLKDDKAVLEEALKKLENEKNKNNEELERKVNELSQSIEDLNLKLTAEEMEQENKSTEIRSLKELLAEEKELQNNSYLEITSLKDSVKESENKAKRLTDMIQNLGDGFCKLFSIVECENQINTNDFISLYFEEGNSNQIVSEMLSKIQNFIQSNADLQFQNSYLSDTVELLTKEKEANVKEEEHHKHAESNTNKQITNKTKELDVLDFIDNLENHWTKKNTLGQGDGSGNHLDMNASYPEDHISSLLEENTRLKDELEDVKDKLCCLISQIETPKIKKIAPLGMAEGEYKRDLGAFPRDDSVPDLLVNQPVTELVSEISSSYIQQLKHSEEAITVLKKDIEIKEEMLIQIKNEFTSLQTKLANVQQNLNMEVKAKNDYIIELDQEKLKNEKLIHHIKQLEDELNAQNERNVVKKEIKEVHKNNLELACNEIKREKLQQSSMHSDDVDDVTKSSEDNGIEEINEISKLKNELGVLKIRNGKMLAKLKQFKDKNDKLQQEVNELTAQLLSSSKDNEDAHKDLMIENARLKDNLCSLETEIEVLKGRVLELSNDIEEKEKAKNNMLIELKEKSDNEISKLKALLKRESTKCEETHQSNILLNNDKLQLTANIKEINEQMELLESDNNNYHILVENLKTTKLKLEEDLKQHLSLLYRVKEEKSLLQSENANLLILKEQYDQLKWKEKEFEEMTANLIRLEELRDNLQEKLNHSETTVANLKKEKMDLELRIINEEEVKQIQTDYKEKLIELKNKCYSYKNEIAQLKRIITCVEKTDNSTMTVSEIECFKNKDDFMCPKCSHEFLFRNQDLVVESHQRSSSKNNDEIEKLIHKLDKLQKNNDEKNAEIERLHTELNELMLALQKARLESEEWHQERSELQALVSEWQNSSKKMDNEFHLQKEKYEILEIQLRTENYELMNKINELQRLVNEIQERFKQKETELINTIDLMDQKEKEISRLSEQLNIIREENKVYKAQITQFNLTSMQNNQVNSDTALLSKSEINHLKAELQQTIQALHHRDFRCEQLTEEITRLIEERDSLQLRLSNSLKSLDYKESHVQQLQRELEEKLHPTVVDHHNEVNVQIEEERQPLMLPATEFSLTRTVSSPTWRIKNWLLGRRNYLYRTWHSKSFYRLFYYMYIFCLHVIILFSVF